MAAVVCCTETGQGAAGRSSIRRTCFFGVHVAALAGLVGCSTATPSVSCLNPGEVEISCPSEVRLDCIAASGETVRFQTTATVCGGGPVTITCTPENGTRIVPGTTQAHCTARSEEGNTARCSFPITATEAGLPTLTCPAGRTVTCSGPETTVALPPAQVDPTCGPAVRGVTHDAPRDGFPVGTHDVLFSVGATGDRTVTCTTSVTVTDSSPPIMMCPSSTVILRTSPSPVAPPLPSADDSCDAHVEVTASKETLERETTAVQFTATNDAGLTTSCISTVQVLDAFPADMPRLVSARLEESGTTKFTLGLEASEGRDVTGYAIERGTDPAGPFTQVAEVDKNERIFTDRAVATSPNWYRVVSLVDGSPGGVSDPVEAHAVRADYYEVLDQTVPGIPFTTTIVGHVRYPASFSRGPAPMVFLMHGDNGNCQRGAVEAIECTSGDTHECPDGDPTVPNAEGLLYLADTLAARGFVAVSIDANALCSRHPPVTSRSAFFRAHINSWLAWSQSAPDGLDAFVGNLDLNQTYLVGHGVSAEGALHAAATLQASPVAGVQLAGIFAVAPTDFERLTPPDLPLAMVAAGCNGIVDLRDSTRVFDRTRSGPRSTRKHMLFLEGATHRFFNRNWPDLHEAHPAQRACLPEDLIDAEAHWAALETLVGEWIDDVRDFRTSRFLACEADLPEAFAIWTSGDLAVRQSLLAPGTAVDDFSGAGAPTVNLMGGENDYQSFEETSLCTLPAGCGTSFAHSVSAVTLRWENSGAQATFDLSSAPLSPNNTLSFRVASRDSAANDGKDTQDFWVRISDTHDRSASILVSDGHRIPHLYAARRPFEVLQSIRIPISRFLEGNPDLNLGELETLTFDMSAQGHSTGDVVVTDIALDNEL